jgi:hypothetical protein
LSARKSVFFLKILNPAQEKRICRVGRGFSESSFKIESEEARRRQTGGKPEAVN